jgi:HTH-type transcriptional regulator / antitoxin HigA
MSKDLEKVLADIFKDNNRISLAELFENRIIELKITKSQAYDALGMDKKSIEPILNNEAKQVDTIKLLKIGEFLDLDVQEVIQYFLNQNTAEKARELEKTRKAKFIFENFDLNGLKKLGFISDIKNLATIEERIKKFFGLQDIYDYWDENLTKAAFSRTKLTSNDRIRSFWTKTAYAQFEAINNPHEFDRARLKKLITRIKPYSRNVEDGFFTVCKALYHTGVTVIFQRKIPNTQVRGATFVVNDKPCIIITDLFKRYGTIWFALLHELFHTLYHMDDIKTRTYHLSGDVDLWLENEEEADDFAREYFLPQDRMKFIQPTIFNHYSVEKYAKEWDIHPCIIYNFYCYDNPDYWPGFSKYDPGIDDSIQKINAMPFDRETVNDTITEIKRNLELV